MKKSAVIINNLWLSLGVLFGVYYLLMGLMVRFGQSMLWVWALGSVFCTARWALWRRAWKKGEEHPFPGWFLMIVRIIMAVGIAFFLFVEFFIVTASFHKPADGLEAVIVLGAKVNDDGPSGSLRERIETAADYLTRNPDTVAIASGGKGEDEPVSEAECIFEGLVERGIDPGRIIIEDQSFSTVDNITNSFAILGEDVTRVGVVTNDFHVFRTLCVGRKFGTCELEPIPARSSVSGYVHYAMREFCALCVSYLRGNLAF